ncbi:metal ABC transporter substrate-binding protein [Marihabitans asiaticum]|uniref:Zinc transport system substrate-binding protein n=1 Tax=Marihabitans asiaticum TaxID=415218 RepID=A0A560WAC4_9MICO|nr:metal ABC transporter substrate-binding protein [Marihabitans asiaticum]TWD14583.1 zinc transport system substrate-binding protein [Marihabitans asiaticum]
MQKLVALSAVAALSLAACGESSSSTEGQGEAAGETLDVVTSFYPLQYAIEQVGGERVSVNNLTKPGAEPHDLELSPQDVLTVSKADALVYLKDFQPAVDDAVGEAKESLDVTEAARLDLSTTDEHEGEGHEHEGDDHDHDHGSQDPHFWLDPMRYADVADAIAEELGRLDPEHQSDYTAAAKDLRTRLTDLDASFTEGLKTCTQDDLVTNHAAFGYLADAYGFHQEAITLGPDTEPSSTAMAEVVAHVKEHDIATIYAETLVPTDVADTIAKETGATVEVLDPIEGVTDSSAAHDYFGIMDANLETLKKGQDCS